MKSAGKNESTGNQKGFLDWKKGIGCQHFQLQSKMTVMIQTSKLKQLILLQTKSTQVIQLVQKSTKNTGNYIQK